MKVGQIGPTFVDPGKMVNFWRVKSVVFFSTLKMRKSKKNEHLYTHTLTCMRENVMVGANLAPPHPSQIGLKLQLGRPATHYVCSSLYQLLLDHQNSIFYDFCGHKMAKY